MEEIQIDRKKIEQWISEGYDVIQDGKLIGAVTHVFIQDSTRGYGIFIENMINH